MGYTNALSWERTPGWYGPPPVHSHLWSKLTPEQQNALLVLGYDQNSFEDINAPQPPADIKIWAELTDKEIEAAKALGDRIQDMDVDQIHRVIDKAFRVYNVPVGVKSFPATTIN